MKLQLERKELASGQMMADNFALLHHQMAVDPLVGNHDHFFCVRFRVRNAESDVALFRHKLPP